MSLIKIKLKFKELKKKELNNQIKKNRKFGDFD